MDGLFFLKIFHQIAGIIQGKTFFLFHLSHLRKIKFKGACELYMKYILEYINVSVLNHNKLSKLLNKAVL